MTDEYYRNRRLHLEEVLRDALARGDCYLEIDVRRQLCNLDEQERHNESEE